MDQIYSATGYQDENHFITRVVLITYKYYDPSQYRYINSKRYIANVYFQIMLFSYRLQWRRLSEKHIYDSFPGHNKNQTVKDVRNNTPTRSLCFHIIKEMVRQIHSCILWLRFIFSSIRSSCNIIYFRLFANRNVCLQIRWKNMMFRLWAPSKLWFCVFKYLFLTWVEGKLEIRMSTFRFKFVHFLFVN